MKKKKKNVILKQKFFIFTTSQMIFTSKRFPKQHFFSTVDKAKLQRNILVVIEEIRRGKIGKKSIQKKILACKKL